MHQLVTERLILTALTVAESGFMLELVNSPGFINNIGQRNITTPDLAIKYTQGLIDQPQIRYWVVKLKDDGTSVGVVTLIQRDYLEHPDIGFAFLPQYTGMGYAYEAAAEVMLYLRASGEYTELLATTLPENENSIKLLEKLGLTYKETIFRDEISLLLYSTGSFWKAIGKRLPK